MKAKRTKYKRTTPKTTVEYSYTTIELGASFAKIVDVVTKLAKRIFGLHYMYMKVVYI